MKKLLSTWLLLLALMCLFTSSVISEETPYIPPPSSGDGSDDDDDGGHPWGGDDNSTGSIGGKEIGNIEPIWNTGFPVIDFMIYVIKREWILIQTSGQTDSIASGYDDNTRGSSRETQSTSDAIFFRRSSNRTDRTQIR